jgi:exportin-2 (importin alpha re-exporter)
LVKLFHEPQYLKNKSTEDADVGLTDIDYEEQSAGYQAAYSKLAASQSPEADPVAYVQDPRDFLGQELVKFSKSNPQTKALLQAADPAVVGPFVQALSAAGYIITA